MKTSKPFMHAKLATLFIISVWIFSIISVEAQVRPPQNIHVIPIHHISPQQLQIIRTFHIVNENQDTVPIQASLQDFQLRADQNFGSFELNQTILSLDEVPEDVNVLPEGFVVRGENNETYYFQFLLSEKEAVQINPRTKQARGSLILQAVESNVESLGNVQSIKLKEPIELIFQASGTKDQTVFVEKLNWPPITVEFLLESEDEYPDDIFNTRMLTIFKPMGYETPITVDPYILVSATKDKIQGFGIQQCPVHISLMGSSDYTNISVGLSADKGYFEQDIIELQKGVQSTAYLRSEKIGEARISVITDMPVIDDIVHFVFPWSFLLFSIIGAAIGSLIRVLRNKKKAFDTRSFIIGILLGFTVSVCYWALGLDLLNLDLSINYINEFAVIALSILGGLLGAYIGRSKLSP